MSVSSDSLLCGWVGMGLAPSYKIFYFIKQQTMETERIYTNVQQFFNFEFVVVDDELIECRLGWQVIDIEVWKNLLVVKHEYDEKNERLKKRTKMFDRKQKEYCKCLEVWEKEKKHYQEHIKKCETKLTEYKNTILAFGKLASCNSISK